MGGAEGGREQERYGEGEERGREVEGRRGRRKRERKERQGERWEIREEKIFLSQFYFV